MKRTFCDRSGQLITAEGFTMTWFNGTDTVTSDLCPTCHTELIAWFKEKSTDPSIVTPDDLAAKLQTTVDGLQRVGIEPPEIQNLTPLK